MQKSPSLFAVAAFCLLSSVRCVTGADLDQAGPTVHCGARLHSIAENGVTNTWTYDADGRVIAITGSNGRTQAYSYDLKDHPATITETITFDVPDVGPVSGTNVYMLGQHGLAETDSEGVSYEYDHHRYLVKEVGTNFVATWTIVDGNPVLFTRTGYPYALTVSYTYTAIDFCIEGNLSFLGKKSRNWPAQASFVNATGHPVVVNYAHGFDDLGRVATQTTTITIDSIDTYTRIAYYTYE
jgi:YD repeat-containing protein